MYNYDQQQNIFARNVTKNKLYFKINTQKITDM